MAWRGGTTTQHRLLSCLPYILPLIQVYGFGIFLFSQFPFLQWLYVPLLPVIQLYNYLNQIIPFIGADFIIFFALYLGVVRNEKVQHFIRFHTLQALLLSIFAYLCMAILQLIGIVQQGASLSVPLLGNVMFTLIFLAVVVASIYSIVQAVRGLYTKIPLISQAAEAGIHY
ncbi:Tic20 family protein [Mastigocladopsis repens]|uniref:Tic20 family protein n=1 Tax=Mastigocladopsis repens TaxID=221287 RepID=UPI00031A507C|nr:Tic20 family protein [Mastigocladopsis repens]